MDNLLDVEEPGTMKQGMERVKNVVLRQVQPIEATNVFLVYTGDGVREERPQQ